MSDYTDALARQVVGIERELELMTARYHRWLALVAELDVLAHAEYSEKHDKLLAEVLGELQHP